MCVVVGTWFTVAQYTERLWLLGFLLLLQIIITYKLK